MATALLIAIGLLAALALALKLLFTLPDRQGFPEDPPVLAGSGSLVPIIDQITSGREGETGLLPLPTGIEAIAMRLAMVRNAERSIDAQYYIWEDDLSGTILLREMIAAADRGVSVRLLIDDNPTAGLDPMWAAISSHPNIAVRLFNPLTIRQFRPLNYLFDFPRLNRRMHNKSLTVDGVATLVGGRNVGDVYFDAADESLFIDLDMLAIGYVVPGVSEEFQRYWESESSYPAELVLDAAGADDIEEWRNPAIASEPRTESYLAAADHALDLLDLNTPDEALIWARVDLLVDDPAKGLGYLPEEDLLAAQIAPLISGANRRFDLVSGYFVPADFGTEMLVEMAERGVKTRVVTNSIQVTDVALVHAGYVPSRLPLLKAGVAVFEARPRDVEETVSARELGQFRFSGGGESVHAKTFAIDAEKLFVGSFNFDPRSALLNCEMGFVIHSPELAQGLITILDERLPETAYSLSLDDGEDIVWTSYRDGQTSEETTEPGTTMAGRILVWSLSKLPIAWML